MNKYITFRVSIMVFCLCLLLSSFAHGQGTWSSVSSDGFTARFAPTTNELGGKIYVAGGLNNFFGGCTNIVEVYDPYTNTWSTPVTTGTFTPRFYASSAVVEGKIYVMGGVGGVFPNNDTLNTLEVFDPGTSTWSTPVTTGSLTARVNYTSAVVNGKIYVIGGFDGGIHITTLEVFDPSTNTWSAPAVSGSFTPRRGLASCVVDGKIYTFAGGNRLGTESISYNIVEVFDPLTSSWSTLSTTGTFTPRRGLAVSYLDDKIYAIGGYDSSYLNTVEVLDLTTNTWTTPTTTGAFTARYAHTATDLGGKIYTFAGQTGGGSNIQTNISEVFTPQSSGVADAASPQFEIFPNPTSGIITVHNTTAGIQNVTVTNVLGEKVMELTQPQAIDFMIDLSAFPSGTYVAKFESAGSVTTKIIIKD